MRRNAALIKKKLLNNENLNPYFYLVNYSFGLKAWNRNTFLRLPQLFRFYYHQCNFSPPPQDGDTKAVNKLFRHVLAGLTYCFRLPYY